jgi:hypothetical protein
MAYHQVGRKRIMTRRIGYYNSFKKAPDQPISIVAMADTYGEPKDDKVEFFVSFGEDKGAYLSVKELGAFRDAACRALEDADNVLAASRKQQGDRRRGLARVFGSADELPEADTESV